MTDKEKLSAALRFAYENSDPANPTRNYFDDTRAHAYMNGMDAGYAACEAKYLPMVEMLEKALVWYADKKNYTDEGAPFLSVDGPPDYDINHDEGHTAHATLTKLAEMRGPD